MKIVKIEAGLPGVSRVGRLVGLSGDNGGKAEP